MRWWIVCVAATASGAQSPVLLDSVKARAQENLKRLPDYTCTENVERSLQGRRERRLRHRDTVRLNVAYVGGKELFGLPRTGTGLTRPRSTGWCEEASAMVNSRSSLEAFLWKIERFLVLPLKPSWTGRRRSVSTTTYQLAEAVSSCDLPLLVRRSLATADVFGWPATVST